MKSVKEILIDTSSSMGEVLPGNKRKIELAKEILITKIIPFISSTDSIGVRLFGGKCNIVGALQNIPNADIKRLIDFVRNEIPPPGGSTPLALAIRTSVDNLKNQPDALKEIFLVTDGEETCGGNIIEAADYAASNGIKCKIHIVAIGELTDVAKKQFEYITNRTGGKNLNIGIKSTNKLTIDKELSDLFETDIDSFSDCVDNEYDLKNEQLIRYEVKNMRDFLRYKQMSVNYIPSMNGSSCQKLLVVEFFNDDDGLENLITAIEHVENCGITNKEVLILMKKWDESYYAQFFKPWVKQFKIRGVDRYV
jgi:hypothetical protein